MKRRVHVFLDGKNIAYRSYYAHKELSHKGVHTGLYHGVIQHLNSIKNLYPSAKFYWCWDGHIRDLWRRKLDPTYKDHRLQGSEATVQVNHSGSMLAAILASLGIHWIEHKELEADDLASIIAHTKFDDQMVVFGTTDRDYYQLLRERLLPDGSAWWRIHKQGPYTLEHLIDEYKIGADRWVYFRALTGDTSDGLKGLPGCGPKKAKELLEDYGALPQLPWDQQPHSLRVKFESRYAKNWWMANLAYRLSTLPRSVADLQNVVPGLVLPQYKGTVPDEKMWVNYCNRLGLIASRNKFEFLTN